MVNSYMEFIIARATGELPTIASWMRSFVTNHKDYKHDSVVSEKIASDLVHHCDKITRGEVHDKDLLGNHFICKTDCCKDRVALDAEKKMRLRGASFHEEIETDNKFLFRCSLVRSLVDKYKNMPSNKHNLVGKGFEATVPFLDLQKAAQ